MISEPSIRICTTPDETLHWVEVVRRYADQHRETFGFLPAAVYEEKASRGHLWIAAEQDEVLGYLIFGGVFPNIRITQLFVVDSARKRGIGKLLLEKLVQFGAGLQYQTISARVAADLPANSFYKAQKFHIVRQVLGGQTTGRTINECVLVIEGNSLFPTHGDSFESDILECGIVELGRPSPKFSEHVFVLDLNVFFDVIHAREGAEQARRIFSSALRHSIAVRVSSEFAEELRKVAIAPNVDPILKLATALPTLPQVDSSELRKLEGEILAIVFPQFSQHARRAGNDLSDVRHLACCITHRATAFVTREKAILRAGSALKVRYGLEVLSPSDLLDEIEPHSHVQPAITANFGAGGLSIDDLDTSRVAAVVNLMRRLGVSDEQQALALDTGTKDALRVRYVASVGQDVAGFSSWATSEGPDPEVAAFLFVDEQVTPIYPFIDHVLEVLSRMGKPGRTLTVNLYSCTHQARTRLTASQQGYVGVIREGAIGPIEYQRKLSYPGVVSQESWSQYSAVILRKSGLKLSEKLPKLNELIGTGVPISGTRSNRVFPIPLFDFETRFGPVFLLAEGRKGLVVPIIDSYANELLQGAAKQLSFHFGGVGALQIEKAYFSSQPLRRGISRGMPVVFYASGANGGRKAAIGVGRVTYFERLTSTQAFNSLQRQGVLSMEELNRMAANDGKLSVFTFDNFLPFPNPVPFEVLKSLGAVSGANLVTAQLVGAPELQSLLESGFQR